MFLNKYIHIVKRILYGLGKIINIKFHERLKEGGVICEAEYAFTSQAFAAKAVMNGMFFKSTGYISVDVIETKRGKAVMDLVKLYIMDYLNKSQY